jgi:hypothetical protein
MDLNKLHTSIIDCSRGRLTKDELKTQLESFIMWVKTDLKPLKKKQDYIVKNNDILAAIKFEVEYLIKEPHVKPNTDLIRLRDRIYACVLRDVQIVQDMRVLTNIFNEFMKGITYFQNQKPNANQPIYHRSNSSCPSRGLVNEVCNATNVDNVSLQKQKRIRTCNIERLVYDSLWAKFMFSPQDIGHIDWLGKTKQAYQTCFPDKDIFIEIELDESINIPLVLKIYDHDETIEVYEKTYDKLSKTYVDHVLCFLYDSDGKMMTRKEMTFDNYVKWDVMGRTF